MKNWITVCAYCNKYRRNGTSWLGPVISQSELQGILSHGACPECYNKVLLEMMQEVQEELVFCQGA